MLVGMDGYSRKATRRTLFVGLLPVALIRGFEWDACKTGKACLASSPRTCMPSSRTSWMHHRTSSLFNLRQRCTNGLTRCRQWLRRSTGTSWNILRVTYDWSIGTMFELEGFVREADVRSPIDYRAIFQRRNGQWFITAFTLGA
jgi:hypothetical protein